MVKKLSRKEQSEATRKRIINAGLNLFAVKGYANVTIEEIAREANCSPGNIYHYFKNGKEGIAAHTTTSSDSIYKDFFEKLRSLPKYNGMTPLEKLLEFQHVIFDQGYKETGIDFVYVYGLKYAEEGLLKVDERRQLYKVYQSLFQECIDAGYIDEKYTIDELIQFFVVISRGVFVEWLICERSFDLIEKGMEMSKVFISGLQQDK